VFPFVVVRISTLPCLVGFLNMAKELPYYKFYATEWITGNITLEDMATQGVFINACSYYWQRGCSLALATLKQRLSHHSNEIEALLKNNIIKHDVATDKISISFLDEQWMELSEKHEKLSVSGKKGGKNSAKARSSEAQGRLKPGSSNREVDKEGEVDIGQAQGFDRFWQAYPKKVGMRDAMAAWNDLNPDTKTQIDISAAIVKHKESQDWTDKNGKFIPNAAKWLTEHRWNDVLTPKEDIKKRYQDPHAHITN